MSISSLHTTMNTLTERPGLMGLNIAGQPLTETEALLNLDPPLAGLYKGYLEARTRYRSLKRIASDHDMANAADEMDSAESAFITRLMEVRRMHNMREAAQSRLKAVEKSAVERIANAMPARAAKRLDEANTRSRLRTKTKKARQRNEDAFFTVILLLWMMNSMASGGKHRNPSILRAFSAAA